MPEDQRTLGKSSCGTEDISWRGCRIEDPTKAVGGIEDTAVAGCEIEDIHRGHS
jgi:hypothetical protein